MRVKPGSMWAVVTVVVTAVLGGCGAGESAPEGDGRGESGWIQDCERVMQVQVPPGTAVGCLRSWVRSPWIRTRGRTPRSRSGCR